jgi:hypothetical protein
MPVNDHPLLMPHVEVVSLDCNCNSSLPLTRDILMYHTKLVFEVHKLHSRKRLGQHVSYMLVYSDILELHFSPLYYISDLMVPDLDMLRLFMEHWVLFKLHTTPVVTPDTSRL